jgi:hypothetical protein
MEKYFMKALMLILLGITLLVSQDAAAHGEHEYQQPSVISESVALIIAQRATTSMSRKDVGLGFGQLPESWSKVPREDMSTYKKGRGYYVVAVLNKDQAKTLYVLMSDMGEVFDANMSGEFEGID